MAKRTYSTGQTPAAAIRKALGAKPYHMSLTGSNITLMKSVVNEGIDSHLEAVTESTFTWESAQGARRLVCSISPRSMLCVLRRLQERGEAGNEEAATLRSDILTTLKIEEI